MGAGALTYLAQCDYVAFRDHSEIALLLHLNVMSIVHVKMDDFSLTGIIGKGGAVLCEV